MKKILTQFYPELEPALNHEELSIEIENLKQDVDTKIEGLKQEIDIESLKKEISKIDTIKGEDGKDGQDYILTEDDKIEIASRIEVPIVEKVIEKTETIIKEIPVITNEVIEKVVIDTPDDIANKLNTLEERIEPKVIIGLEDKFDKFAESFKKGGKNQLKLNDVAGAPLDQRWHGGGLSKVSHDSTLSGSGTPTDPLKVVNSPETQNLQAVTDLGSTTTNTITVPAIKYNTSYTPTGSETTGTRYWDSANHTTTLVLENGVKLQDGQEIHIYGKNTSGSTILDGTPVSIVQNNGQFTAFGPVDITTAGAYAFVGLATQDIANNNFGYVTKIGVVNDIDTSSYDEGKPVYVSPTGGLTKTYPTVPNYVINVGIVEYKHAVHGRINVIPLIVPRFYDLSDVNGTPLTADGQIATWHNTSKYFDFDKNINNYLPYTGATSDVDLGTHKITGTFYGDGSHLTGVGGEFDGGFANSVYLISQMLDGGFANSTYTTSQVIDGGGA